MKKRNILYITLFALGALAACKKNVEVIYSKVNDDRLPVIVANTNFTTPTLTATSTVSGGTTIPVELDFVQTDPIKNIQFLQKIGTADSTILTTVNYAPAFSKNKQCDTLLYNYVVPSNAVAPIGTAIVFRARVNNQNGLFRDKTTTFKTKL